MKVLAFDQATRLTGYAYFQDGVLLDSGIIDCMRIYNAEDRFDEMVRRIVEKINSCKPDLVIYEDVDMQTKNPSIIKLLANMQGVIQGKCIISAIPYLVFKPQVWRSKLHFKQGPKVKRSELKKQALDWTTQHLGWEPQEDEAEAICIGAAYWVSQQTME